MTYTYDALNRLASAKDSRIAMQGGSANPTGSVTFDNEATVLGKRVSMRKAREVLRLYSS